MSLIKINLEAKGDPIAIIKDASIKGPDQVVYLGEGGRYPTTDLILEKEEKFQMIPHPNKRTCHAIFGQAGSGKSFWCLQYIKEYIKMYPKRAIYFFSTITSELGCLKDIKKMKVIDINHSEFIDDEFPVELFKDSLVLMDDIDNIHNKKLKKKVFNILNDCLAVGRKFNVDVIVTFHNACCGQDTKTILNESNSISINCKTMGNRSIKYLLDSYLGLDKNQIERVKKLNSRMVTIMKTYPKVVLSEKELFILN